MPSLEPYLFAIALGGWFALTIHRQLAGNSLKHALWRGDVLGLIPEWRFFAPNPPQHNYELLVRYQWRHGDWSAWQEVNFWRSRSSLNFVWNPWRRQRKAMADIVNLLILTSKRTDPGPIWLSVGYLLILKHVTSLARTSWAERVQFAIFQHDVSVEDHREVFFVSHQHPVR